MLWVGNPYPCENPFKWAVKGRPGSEDKGGDIPRPYDDYGGQYIRRVIQIKAIDSPNVQYAQAEISKGLRPSGRIVIPGVLPYSEYVKRLKFWDEVKKCAGLDAEFYEGGQALLFPPNWLNRAEERHRNLIETKVHYRRDVALAAGCDTGEGRADTVFCAVDNYGIMELLTLDNSNAFEIVKQAIAFIHKWKIPPEKFLFDRGGGGRQIADFLRAKGYNVQTIPFGGRVGRPGDDNKRQRLSARGTRIRREKGVINEDKGVWSNRRSQMYGEFSALLDPNNLERPDGFAIPAEMFELRRQLARIPRKLDGEGKLFLPPKNKKNPNSNEITMEDLIGRSPDHADAVVLAVHGLLHHNLRFTAGAIDWDNIEGNPMKIGKNSENTIMDLDNYGYKDYT